MKKSKNKLDSDPEYIAAKVKLNELNNTIRALNALDEFAVKHEVLAMIENNKKKLFEKYESLRAYEECIKPEPLSPYRSTVGSRETPECGSVTEG